MIGTSISTMTNGRVRSLTHASAVGVAPLVDDLHAGVLRVERDARVQIADEERHVREADVGH
jgi:hypothetical protein